MQNTDLPNGWISLKLSESVCPRGERVTPSKYPELPFIGMDHVESHTTKIIGNVPSEKMKSNASIFYANDLLYGRLRPYLNKLTIPPFNGLASAEFIVIPSNELIQSNFLKYRMNSMDFVRFACHLNEGDRPRVSFAQIGEFEILIPPLPEQRRIVAKIEELFSELENGIEALKTIQQQLKVYRQAVLKCAFEGKLTEEWRKQQKDLPTSQALLEQIIKEHSAHELINDKRIMKNTRDYITDSVPFDIDMPMFWCWVKLDSVGELARGKSRHRPRNAKELFGGKYPFIQTGEVRAAGNVIKSYENTYSEFGLSQSRLWPNGTLCITIAANIAETAFLGFDACFPDSIVGFSSYDRILSSKYVFYFFKGNKQRIENFAPATAQKNINLNTLENLYIPYCSLPEQHAIIQEIESRLSVADKLEETIAQSLKQAEALRQSILKKAFLGRLLSEQELAEARSEPDWEPASVLLERIKSQKISEPKNNNKRGKKQA